MLGLGRIAHSLSLAYCLYAMGIAKLMQATWFYRPLLLIGQHGLPMFGLTSVLSAVGHVVTTTFGHTLLIDSAVIAGGLALTLAAAHALSRKAHSVPVGVAGGAAMR